MKQTLISLLNGFPSSKEEDTALLEESSMSGGTSDIGPIKRNAILIRARERRILQTSIYKLNQRRRSLLHFSYQITEVREKENKRLKLIEEKLNFKKKAVQEFLSRDVLINISVIEDLKDTEDAKDHTVANFTVCEGDNLELLARAYVLQYGNEQNSIDTNKLVTRVKNIFLKKPTKQIIFMFPIILSNGTRAILRMRQQDDGTEEVLKFCAVHNMTDRICDWMRSNLATHVEAHFKDSVSIQAKRACSTVVDISIFLPLFVKYPNKSFFNAINIWTLLHTLSYSIYYTLQYFLIPTSILL